MAKKNLDNARFTVQQEFANFGCRDQDSIQESILLSRSMYVGHRFVYRRWQAEWRLQADSVTIFEGEQEIKSANLLDVSSSNRPQDRAA